MKLGTTALVALFACAGCTQEGIDDPSSTTPPPAEADPVATQAQELFWDTFLASRYDALPEALDALEGAFEEDPTNHRTALLLGLGNMWALGENERNPELGPVDFIGYYQDADTYFTAALDLDPADLRPHGWLGNIQITVGMNTGDAGLIEEGQAGIDKSKEYNEIFGTFVDSLQYRDLPASDPGYDKGVDLMFHALDLCLGEPLDRENPDFTPHMSRETTEGPARICWDIPEAPHGFEAFHASMGELLLKQGKVDVAQIFFDNVKLGSGYESWPFKARFEERAGRDLAAEVPLLQDEDPTNDPPSFDGNMGCGSCHATSIPE